MAVSPRWFIFITVILGTVLASKLQYVFDVEGIDGNMIRNIATNVAGGFHLLIGIVQGKRLIFPQRVRPYLLLIVIAVLSLPWAIDLVEGVRFVSILMIPILVLFVSGAFFDREDYLWVFRCVSWLAMIQLIVGTVEYFVHPESRVSALHDVPAVLSWFLCVVVLVNSYLVYRKDLGFGFLTLYLVWSSVIIVLTGARIGLLMFPAALLYVFRQLRTRKVVVFAISCLSLVVVSLIFIFQMNIGTGRLGVEVGGGDFEFVGEAGGTIAWRLLLWERLLGDWVNSPWVGYGAGADFAVSLKGGVTSDLNYVEDESLNTHNEYVKILYNHGLIGLVLLIWFGFNLLSIDTQFKTPLSGLVSFGAILWLIFSVTDNGLSYHGVTSLIFLFISFCCYENIYAALGRSSIDTLRPRVSSLWMRRFCRMR